MRKRVFGFDLGIASIGWAVVEIDKEHFDSETGEVIEGKIVKAGVRCFPVAENPKDGSSLAAPRREKRLLRRLVRRKARRMKGIKDLFVKKDLVSSKEELEKVYANQIGGDVWNLRVKALSEALTKEELVRVLTHLAKHRGFLSYRKAVEESDQESGKILKAINENKDLALSYQTIAQMIVDRSGTGKKRNYTSINAKGQAEAVYVNSIPRKEIIKEADIIFDVQKQYGILTQELFEDYKKIAFRYRPVSSVEDMVGYCQLEHLEKRAPKEAPSSELFVALGKINHLTVFENAEKRFLTASERADLLELLKTTKTVKYATISKKIFKEKNIQFSDIDYDQNEKKDKNGTTKTVNPEDKTFYSLTGWHKFKAAFNETQWQYLINNIELFDNCVNVLACQKNDLAIEQGLTKLNLPSDIISVFKGLTTDKFINLSFKAIYQLIPFMQEGDSYYDACVKCGYDPQNSGEKLLDKKDILLGVIKPEKLTTVPVVNRTVTQFRKVYNAMVRTYGAPDQINIEFTRDLKKSHDERRNIEKKRDENNKEREQAKQKLREWGIPDTNKNVLKYRLYEQQHGKCIYSNKEIDITRLDENGYCDVDHILPYSKSLDDSFNNKVLCLSEENRKKGNKTPYEYLNPLGLWDEFKTRVHATPSLGRYKIANLIITKDLERELEFRERNLNDSSYIAKYVKKYLEDGIDFSNSFVDIKNRVQTRNGALTDYLRHCWGLHKDRNENDKHHAQDAIVVACATQGMVQYLSYVSSVIEDKYRLIQKNGEAWYKSLKHRFQEPWLGFKNDVDNVLADIFVSRPPRKKASGEIHQETIRTLNPNHKNYDAKTIKSGIKVRGGFANNGDMLRTDVFVKKNKRGKDEFYLVPVYLYQMGQELPNKAISPLKSEDEWIVIDESFTFKFSLYKDDLIRVTKGDKAILGYFKGTNRFTGAIDVEIHDRSLKMTGIGVKTQDKVQKYQVSPLGEIVEVKKETRLSLKMKKR